MGGRGRRPVSHEPTVVRPIRAMVDGRKHELPPSTWNVREDLGREVVFVGPCEIREFDGKFVIYKNGKWVGRRPSLAEAIEFASKLAKKKG